MSKIILYTIGFTKKNAEMFFAQLRKAKVAKIIDIRLNNISQLAGFAKRDDLIFFLRNLCDCNYVHLPELAPTKDILESYKKKKMNWKDYENQFINLISHRNIENKLAPESLNNSCLLCSEFTADQCHRRLVAEYLQKKIPDIQIRHL